MENIISDTKIFHINKSKAENFADSIMYYDKYGKPQQIDLDICAKNYQQEHNRTSAICIGERDITKGYFQKSSKKIVEYITKFYCDLTATELIVPTNKT
ncbi:MAG: hypothetical protein UE295_01325, partial [Acutalibacteraceae bacterium]|nr:hypothetical protein [Acutalibacteraceae bacterium]